MMRQDDAGHPQSCLRNLPHAVRCQSPARFPGLHRIVGRPGFFVSGVRCVGMEWVTPSSSWRTLSTQSDANTRLDFSGVIGLLAVRGYLIGKRVVGERGVAVSEI